MFSIGDLVTYAFDSLNEVHVITRIHISDVKEEEEDQYDIECMDVSTRSTWLRVAESDLTLVDDNTANPNNDFDRAMRGI